MRILVTGASNAFGAAVCRALADDGHTVRAFGIPPGEDPFHHPAIEAFPGDIATGGSIEPVAAECQALVHCATLDTPGKDREAHAVHLERGTLYARYGAERELVTQFLALFPTATPRAFAKALAQAETHVRGTRRLVPHAVLRVGTPEEAVRQVREAVSKASTVVA